MKIEIRGARQLAASLSDGDLIDDLLRPGFKKSAVIVEGAWKGKAHRVTGKYQGSLGHNLTGQGVDLEAHIGPQPGVTQPRHYSAGMTSHWRKPRKGVNRGDPQVYAVFEDQGTRYRPGHPAAEPALSENVDQIGRVIASEADRAMERRFP